MSDADPQMVDREVVPEIGTDPAMASGDRQVSAVRPGGLGLLVGVGCVAALGGLIMVWNAADPLVRGDVARARFAHSYDAVVLILLGVPVMVFGILCLWAAVRRSGGRPGSDAEASLADTAVTANSVPGPVTVRSGRSRQELIVVMFFFVLIALEPVFARPRWAQHLPAAAFVAGYLVAVSAVAAAVCARVLLMGVRFDSQGITVRNLWRTRMIAWQDVERLEDGTFVNTRREREWVLRVALKGGRCVSASATRSLRASGLNSVRQAAARYGIPATINGEKPR